MCSTIANAYPYGYFFYSLIRITYIHIPAHTYVHFGGTTMMVPQKKLLSNKSKNKKQHVLDKNIVKKNVKKYTYDNVHVDDNNNSNNTQYSPAKFLYQMRMKNNDEERINEQNAKILRFHQQKEQSQVLDASLSDSFHINHKRHRNINHTRGNKVTLQSASLNKMNVDALKAMVVQQASLIAELETENTFLKNLIIEQQHEQQRPSHTGSKFNNNYQQDEEAKLSYEQ